MKKIMFLMSLVLLLVGCSKGSETKKDDSGEEVLKIGVLQFAQHPSLDNCREGFIEGLKEEGFEEGKNLEIDYQNAEADMGIAAQIANSFVSNKSDMIAAIATPAAMSSYNAARKTDIPVVYTAICDPIGAELADENKNPLGNITGTSDILPVEEQLQLIRKLLPEAKNIGILHTSSEANSDSMLKIYKKLAGKYGFNIVDEAINTTSDVALATDNLLSKVDVMTNLLDNTVVNSLPSILNKANEKKIPVFASEIEQVKMGCLASEGIEYISLGKQTGKMAAKILKGERKASEMPYETILEANLYINTKVADNLGIKIPKDLLDRAAENFEEISSPEVK